MKRILMILYGVALAIFVTFSYLFVDPNLSFLHVFYSGFSSQQKTIVTVFYALFLFISLLFYLWFIRLYKKGVLQRKDIYVLIAIAIATLFFSYPAILSYDIFNYVTTARVTFFYGENPYVVMPIDFIGDPYVIFTHAANKVALYGPLWILLSVIPYVLGFGNFLATLFATKFLVVFFYLGLLVFLRKLSNSVEPVILFGLNPLVIVETLVSSHNDVVMMFFAIGSFYFLKKKSITMSLLFLLCSIGIKYATVFLIPVYLFAFWKTLKTGNVKWSQIHFLAGISMFVIFLLSPIREEMYPWYFIWVLPFIFLIPEKKWFVYGVIALCFGLLLRYIPFMLLGTHAGPTPTLKLFFSFLPPALLFIVMVCKKVWVKTS